ncbi:MAG: AAA family ATPase, partial [Chloroflexi bacterium]|nr:AAA family ATPase [Chloroflexota bacterium]
HQAELLARMRGLLSRFGPSDAGVRGRPPMGKMVAFYGAKGGVGATTIAINTAIALHNGLDRKVALVDAVLQFGDHRVFLDLGNDRKSVTDLMAVPQADADLLKSVLVKHDSGVDLLLAPTSPEEADLVTPERFAAILAMLRSMYDYVIVDVDKRLGDLVLSILDHADEVHIVMTADLSCLKNVRLAIEALRKTGFDPKRLKLVLNRSNAFTGVSVSAAEGALKREFETKVPNEYRIAISAQNTGSPFSYSKPESLLAKEIADLAQSIDTVFAPQIPAVSGVAAQRAGAARAR